ncbi:hypothetical protein OG898_33250 [Streptomyces sp. NBC_00193]|nr:hypothetical protein [Streptomyces sp. NBC_00193]
MDEHGRGGAQGGGDQGAHGCGHRGPDGQTGLPGFLGGDRGDGRVHVGEPGILVEAGQATAHQRGQFVVRGPRRPAGLILAQPGVRGGTGSPVPGHHRRRGAADQPG